MPRRWLIYLAAFSEVTVRCLVMSKQKAGQLIPCTETRRQSCATSYFQFAKCPG